MNALLFGFVVMVWGVTWYAIKLQLGSTPPEVSIFWRFLLSALMIWAGLLATGRWRPAPWRGHFWFAALGLALFCLNFLCFYNAEGFIASGVVSVVFSMASAFNVGNQWLFRGIRPAPRVVVGAVIGALGVGCLFADQLIQTAAGGRAAIGVALALGGAYCFSLGNLASLPATRAAGDLPNAIARSMSWGAAFLALFVAARGLSFAPSLQPVYLGALVYLAAFGSVLGFLVYLALVSRIGPERAAYTTVLSPVIALGLSWLLEGYVWTEWAFLGAPLILIGNVVIFARRRDV